MSEELSRGPRCWESLGGAHDIRRVKEESVMLGELRKGALMLERQKKQLAGA